MVISAVCSQWTVAWHRDIDWRCVMFADLVLEGGGVKGIALVGAISVLEERGYGFRRVAGTSAGAIVAALAAAGMRAPDLSAVMGTVDYRRFRDGDLLDHLGAFGTDASGLIDY